MLEAGSPKRCVHGAVYCNACMWAGGVSVQARHLPGSLRPTPPVQWWHLLALLGFVVKLADGMRPDQAGYDEAPAWELLRDEIEFIGWEPKTNGE